MLDGSYEMGVTTCEREITSEEAYTLPVVAKFILSAGSYYEMTHTHSMHYVKPLAKPSLSLMMTGGLYPEPRVEAKHDGLQPLSEDRKMEILGLTKKVLNVPDEYAISKIFLYSEMN
jgi:hypothetical protein